MASHHSKNAVGVSAAPLDGPGSGSSASKISVGYPGAEAMDTPTSPSSIRPTNSTPGTGAIEVDGPNTPDPMGSNGPTSPSY